MIENFWFFVASWKKLWLKWFFIANQYWACRLMHMVVVNWRSYSYVNSRKRILSTVVMRRDLNFSIIWCLSLVWLSRWSTLICKTLRFYIKIKMEAERDWSVMLVQLGVGKIPNHPLRTWLEKTSGTDLQWLFSAVGWVLIGNENTFPTGFELAVGFRVS